MYGTACQCFCLSPGLVVIPQCLDSLGRELIWSGLHVFQDVLIGINDDKFVPEDFDNCPESKVLLGVKHRIVSCTTARLAHSCAL